MKKEDKKIEDLIDKLMAEDSVEQPSLDFIDNIMSKVEAFSESKPIVYKPLISKSIWLAIIIGFLVLIGFLLFKKPTAKVSFAKRYNLPDVSFNFLEGLSFNFSSPLMYAIVLMAVMLSIQIPLLKYYVNNRLSY